MHFNRLLICVPFVWALACSDSSSEPDGSIEPDGALADAASDGLPSDTGDGSVCSVASLPSSGESFQLTAAGAPAPLFGPASAPTFREGFETLRDSGFTRFFPLFLTREIVDRPAGDMTPSASSRHEPYFSAGTCRDGLAFQAAADAGMDILFPAFFFFPEGDMSPFSADAAERSFRAYQEDCFGENESVITGYYSYDEMSSNWAGIELGNRAFGADAPLPLIANASAMATWLRTVTDVPVYAIDGPAAPLLERDRAPIAGAGVNVDLLLADYETELRAFAESADVFGFDAYPIPESYWFPIQTSGDLVQTAREVAPGARTAAVLQGMSFDAQGGHTGIGATGAPPSLAQTRFMAYDAIVNGAEELIWYGPNFLDLEREADAQFWRELQSVVAELSTLGRGLRGTRRSLDVDASDVRAVAFEVDDGELIVLVHRAAGDVEAQLSLPGTRLVPFVEGDAIDDGVVPLGAYEVRIFFTSTCTE